jgi:phenol hydroxylase P0 protein
MVVQSTGDDMVDEFDTKKRFVRFIEKRDDDFVLFEFAVGEPEIFAEMILKVEDYEIFCKEQGVVMIDQDTNPIDKENDFEWRLRDATDKRLDK